MGNNNNLEGETSEICCCCCCLATKSYLTPNPPGSFVHGISQAKILDCVVISFSRGCSQPGNQTQISVSPVLAGRFFTTEPPGKPPVIITTCYLEEKERNTE